MSEQHLEEIVLGTGFEILRYSKVKRTHMTEVIM